MKSLRCKCMLFLYLACLLLLYMPATVAHQHTTQTFSQQIQSDARQPALHPSGRKWRIGYIDSGDYSEYPHTLLGIVNGLMTLGWLTVPSFPASLNSEQLWAFLVNHVQSDYIEFVADAWWHPGYADPKQRLVLRDAISDRIATRGDLDLMIAMGTWAGQDMALLKAPIPTIVASTSDPIRSKIILSETDSGLDNLHARIDSDRYQRQIRLFHEIVPFKRLGLVYENSLEGEAYSGLNAVEEVSKEAGFSIKNCHAAFNGATKQEASEAVIECYRQIAPHIDAAYITVHRGITAESLKTISDILRNANVPSFSMLGAREVQQGILLGLMPADESYLGLFYAGTITHILHGTSPRALNQIWIEPTKLAINLSTARDIGFDPPVEALLAADEIFTHPLN